MAPRCIYQSKVKPNFANLHEFVLRAKNGELPLQFESGPEEELSGNIEINSKIVYSVDNLEKNRRDFGKTAEGIK